MARGKKSGALRKLATIFLVLCAVEGLLITYFSVNKQEVPIQEVIDQSIKKTKDQNPEKKLMLALNDYRASHQGKLPASLSELVPKYFTSIPVDPSTGKQYAYHINGDKIVLGQGAASGSGIQQKDAVIYARMLTSEPIKAFPAYDPQGKRDPFRPFDFSPQFNEEEPKSPLETHDLDSLKVTAIFEAGNEPSAVVETADGRGYTLRKGTKIGRNNGEVVEILSDRVRVLEIFVDFTGESKSRTKEMIKGVAASGGKKGVSLRK